MTPIRFPDQNRILGANQPEYLPLPAHMTKDGLAISCWRLTWRERIRLLFTGKLWLMQLTFNEPLQPQQPVLKSPFLPIPTPNPEAV